ncbi:MAG: GNAT family N-acetyltransferase [Pseudomonadota bacterium]
MTDRLVLRPFSIGDAQDVQRLAGNAKVADTTYRIPHPYEDGIAEEWIDSHEAAFLDGTQVVFAITLRDCKTLVGAIGLTIAVAENEAELGYWVGLPYWNRGIATEATAAVLDYGFSQTRLGKIRAWHLLRNPSSGRVMQKAGMFRDERNRRKIKKNDREESLVSYVLSRSDWASQRA